MDSDQLKSILAGIARHALTTVGGALGDRRRAAIGTG